MTLLTVRLALVAACGGFAAYTDARIHKIPDLAWILGLGGQSSSRRSAGRQRGSAEREGRCPMAVGFLPGLLVRQGGLPAFPLGDYLLAVALGALAGDGAVPLAVLLVAGLGLAYGGGLLAIGAFQGQSARESLALRPAFAPVLAPGFVIATAWPLVR